MSREQAPDKDSLTKWKTARNKAAIWRIVLPWSLVLLWVVIVFLPFLLSGNGLRIQAEPISWLNEGWQASTGQEVTLPVNIDVQPDQPLALAKRLPEDFANEQTLCLRSSLQSMAVSLDGQEIYHFDSAAGSQGHRPPTTAWHIIRLPADSEDRLLEIKITSPYSDKAGWANPVFYGRKAAILYYLAGEYGLGLLIAFLIFLTGIMMLFMDLLMKDVKDSGLIYIGFFAIFMSIWLFAESRLAQFFVGNSFFLGSAAFLALTIIPIPLLLYIHENVVAHWRRTYRVFCCWFLTLFIVNLLLQIMGIADFYDLVLITHLSLLMTSVLIAASLVFEYKHFANPEVLPFAKSIFLMIVFFIAELISFYFGDFYPTSAFIRIGIVLFIFSLGVYSLKRVRTAIDNSRRTIIMEKLAYNDILTGALNRTAYDRDLQGIKPGDDRVVIAILDVNDLKKINDSFGHSAGDEAIRLTYNCINESFGKYGSCYRIGGDEFACILREDAVDVFPKRLELFKQLVSEAAAKTEYHFGVAIGYAHSENERHHDIKSFLSHADAMMYICKRKQKKVRGDVNYESE